MDGAGGGRDRNLAMRAAAVVRRVAGVGLPDPSGLRAGRAVRDAGRALGLGEERLLGLAELGDEAAVRALLEAFVVTETSFFRHPSHFEAVRVLLARSPARDFSVWCAGCSTGEEPYSLAMLCEEAGRGARIVATDVSEAALAVARRGEYSPTALRGVSPAMRARHFSAGPGGVLRVREALRERVRFVQHNLLSDGMPRGPFDLVLCRNVLIYFQPDTARAVVERLARQLRAGGVLLVAAGDLAVASASNLARATIHGVTVLSAPVAAAARGAPGSQEVRPADRTSGRRRSGRQREVPPRRDAEGAQEHEVTAALEAARRGNLREARELARQNIDGPQPQVTSYLVEAAVCDARGELEGAVTALGRALYLEPDAAHVHAALVPVLRRLGRSTDAERHRAIALRLLEGRLATEMLPGLEEVSVGALRAALTHGATRSRLW